jgi:hypothetical protein
MKWNMKDYGGKYIIDPNSITEIDGSYTAQGRIRLCWCYW